MIRRLQLAGQAAFVRVEYALNVVFGQAGNPLYHLGAITFFLFWVVAASGIYLYAFFDTGVQDAYNSVQSITYDQWWLGGVMRSLHRYASDAMVITMFIHMLREFALGRFHGSRWFSWLSGIPLIWLVYASGIDGYWLVWDRLSQFIAVATAEWLDWLPIFSEPLVRNFLDQGSVNDRFFTLLSLLHIGIPLILLAFMWVHIQRIAHVETHPPRRMAIGIVAGLLVLALIKPAISQAHADLDVAITQIRFDWIYLTVYPLIYKWSPGGVWALVAGATLVVFVLPWLPREKRPSPIAIHLDNCNGCGRCVADCPYAALTMEPRQDGRRHAQQVMLTTDLCTSCGICVGSCPSSTPFRTTDTLVSGVELPSLTMANLRSQVDKAVASLEGPARVVVFGCQHALPVHEIATMGAAAIGLRCIGMLPPTFIDYVLRQDGADGVLVSGCCEGDCMYRLGDTWTKQRLAGEREPRLRARVATERVHQVWIGATEHAVLLEELERFRERLRKSAGSPIKTGPGVLAFWKEVSNG